MFKRQAEDVKKSREHQQTLTDWLLHTFVPLVLLSSVCFACCVVLSTFKEEKVQIVFAYKKTTADKLVLLTWAIIPKLGMEERAEQQQQQKKKLWCPP